MLDDRRELRRRELTGPFCQCCCQAGLLVGLPLLRLVLQPQLYGIKAVLGPKVVGQFNTMADFPLGLRCRCMYYRSRRWRRKACFWYRFGILLGIIWHILWQCVGILIPPEIRNIPLFFASLLLFGPFFLQSLVPVEAVIFKNKLALAYALAMRWHTMAHPLDVELGDEAFRPLQAQQADVGTALLVGHRHGAC